MTTEQQLTLGIESQGVTVLTPIETVGCYYRDQDGGFWSTIYCSGGLVCSDCGRTFYAGYHGPIDRLSCGCRVKAVYPKRRRGRAS